MRSAELVHPVIYQSGETAVTVTEYLLSGDFLCDGYDDTLQISHTNGITYFELSNGTSGADEPFEVWYAAPSNFIGEFLWQVGDFNNDGFSDLLKILVSPEGMTPDIFFATTEGFELENWPSLPGDFTAADTWTVLDANSDGYADLQLETTLAGDDLTLIYYCLGEGFFRVDKTVYEGEAPANILGGDGYHYPDTTFSGGLAAMICNGPGAFLEFRQLSAFAADQHKLRLYYGTGEDTPLQISLNGTIVDTVICHAVPPLSLGVVELSLPLAQGSNTLRLTATEDPTNINIDRLEVFALNRLPGHEDNFFEAEGDYTHMPGHLFLPTDAKYSQGWAVAQAGGAPGWELDFFAIQVPASGVYECTIGYSMYKQVEAYFAVNGVKGFPVTYPASPYSVSEVVIPVFLKSRYQQHPALR